MLTIQKVNDSDVITDVTLKVMNALPEWFSPPEDIFNIAKRINSEVN